MLVWIYLVLMNMAWIIFFEGDDHVMLILAGLMAMYIGMIYFIYFRKLVIKSILYWFPALFVLALFAGGLLMLLWGAGVLDWFFVDVLGW